MENATVTGEVRFQSLDASLADACEAMTFPRFRHLLLLYPAPRFPADGDRRNVQAVGVVALAGRQPVALALAAIPVDARDEAELLSLFVHPQWRGRGIGTGTLQHLEVELARLGVGRVEGTYTTGKPAIPILEHLFEKLGWDAPAVRTISVRFTPEEARRTPWYARNLLPKGSEVFAWRDLTPAEITELKSSNAAAPWIAPGLEPWSHAQFGYEPDTSVGLRYRGRVVGWVINHRIWNDTVRFTCSFMRADLARRAAILPLYTEAIERADRAGFRFCTFITPMTYRPMVDFVVHRCAAFISFVGQTRGVAKRLAPPAAGAGAQG